MELSFLFLRLRFVRPGIEPRSPSCEAKALPLRRMKTLSMMNSLILPNNIGFYSKHINNCKLQWNEKVSSRVSKKICVTSLCKRTGFFFNTTMLAIMHKNRNFTFHLHNLWPVLPVLLIKCTLLKPRSHVCKANALLLRHRGGINNINNFKYIFTCKA